MTVNTKHFKLVNPPKVYPTTFRADGSLYTLQGADVCPEDQSEQHTFEKYRFMPHINPALRRHLGGASIIAKNSALQSAKNELHSVYEEMMCLSGATIFPPCGAHSSLYKRSSSQMDHSYYPHEAAQSILDIQLSDILDANQRTKMIQGARRKMDEIGAYQKELVKHASIIR